MKPYLKTILQTLFYHINSYKYLNIGENVRINPTSTLNKKSLISIGDHTFIGKWCHITVVEPATLTIGNHVTIAPFVKIVAGDHNIHTVGKYLSLVNDPTNKSISIEDDAWIGMDSMILKWVSIGEGAVVGAKAVVTRTILPYSIAVGNPAKMIKLRFKPQELHRHLKIIGSKYNLQDLLKKYQLHGLLR